MLAFLFGSPTKPPVLLSFRSSKTFIVMTVSSSVFTDVFVYGIVVPVLPFALTSRAAVDPRMIQTWISIFLAVYGAALLAAAPVCGWFADRSSSRRLPLLLGLLALGGSTAMLCVGSSIGVLAAGRVLQGFSAAVVWVVGLALLVDTVGPEEVGQSMGYVGLSMSLAMLVAPLLGGIVFEESGYYAVFAMAFGLIALDVFLRLALIEKKVAAKWLPSHAPTVGESAQKTPTDARQSAADIEMGSIPIDDIQGSSLNQTEQRPTAAARSASTTSAVQAAEAALPENAPSFIKGLVAKLPPLFFLLTSRRVLSSSFVCMIQAALLTAFDTTLPLFVRNTFHWNSIGAGLIFLPLVVTSFIGPVVGHLSDKHGPRWYATAGYVVFCPAVILLRLVRENSIGDKVLLCALLSIVGICLNLILTPMMAEITYAVDAKARRRPPGFFGKNGAYAQAYSLFNMAFAAGCMVGPLLAGLVNQAHGWGATTLLLGAVAIFTAIPTAIWTGGSIFKALKRRRAERGRQAPCTTQEPT